MPHLLWWGMLVFTQPLGHITAQAQLAEMLAQGTMPHALLLHGPRGVGKATLAKWLAARLICGPSTGTERNPLTPNKASAPWAQLAAGSCPDYYVVQPDEGKQSIGIKVVQNLLESLQRSADTARVVVLDALENLTPEAANTLLKTLEEPRPGLYFLLISHQLAGILPTIKSRCRLLKLGTLTEAETASVLAAQGDDMAAAALANGTPGIWLVQTAGQKAALAGLRHGTLPPANTLGLLPLLAQHVATLPPTFTHARLHQHLVALHTQQQNLNLPVTLVNEQALQLVQPHLVLSS